MIPLRLHDLFEDISPGVISHTCKLCGAVIQNKPQHLKWHNALMKMLTELHTKAEAA